MLNSLFSVLNYVLGLLKVGTVFFFLEFVKKINVLIPSITKLLKALIISTSLTLFCCNLLESFKIS